jgi:hypothetical protein
LEEVPLDKQRRSMDDAPVTEEGRSAYRSALGLLNYIALCTRGDLQAAVSDAAQKTTRAVIRHIKDLNLCVRTARKTSTPQLVFRRGVVELQSEPLDIVSWSDNGFANADMMRNQCGNALALTNDPAKIVADLRFDLCLRAGNLPR